MYPPQDCKPDDWVKLIDELFLDPGYMNRSLKNKQNRAKHHYNNMHGSQSYAQKIYLHAQETETRVILRFGERRITRKGSDGRTIRQNNIGKIFKMSLSKCKAKPETSQSMRWSV